MNFSCDPLFNLAKYNWTGEYNFDSATKVDLALKEKIKKIFTARKDVRPYDVEFKCYAFTARKDHGYGGFKSGKTSKVSQDRLEVLFNLSKKTPSIKFESPTKIIHAVVSNNYASTYSEGGMLGFHKLDSPVMSVLFQIGFPVTNPESALYTFAKCKNTLVWSATNFAGICILTNARSMDKRQFHIIPKTASAHISIVSYVLIYEIFDNFKTMVAVTDISKGLPIMLGMHTTSKKVCNYWLISGKLIIETIDSVEVYKFSKELLFKISVKGARTALYRDDSSISMTYSSEELIETKKITFNFEEFDL